jgi:hypothetical protein
VTDGTDKPIKADGVLVGPEITDAQVAQFKYYASLIKNDRTLAHLLSQSSLSNRHTMYESLLPYLPYKPKPYWWFAGKRSKKKIQPVAADA